ncbi:hypothetical protein TIFTF001_017373 [Ficus carica]|uniref:Uncharacterized protein n=1 Tax=Ficus carica TaxID=3494 RepID=A0AA88A936_FICCA|nr:hypothetical protein TIFTF001_017373 [Ficus carica]
MNRHPWDENRDKFAIRRCGSSRMYGAEEIDHFASVWGRSIRRCRRGRQGQWGVVWEGLLDGQSRGGGTSYTSRSSCPIGSFSLGVTIHAQSLGSEKAIVPIGRPPMLRPTAKGHMGSLRARTIVRFGGPAQARASIHNIRSSLTLSTSRAHRHSLLKNQEPI